VARSHNIGMTCVAGQQPYAIQFPVPTFAMMEPSHSRADTVSTNGAGNLDDSPVRIAVAYPCTGSCCRNHQPVTMVCPQVEVVKEVHVEKPAGSADSVCATCMQTWMVQA
jgi:hypothetical protein